MTDRRELKLTMEPLSALLKRKRADNPKLHDEAAIQASIGRAGYVTPTILNELDESLLGGHGRVDALEALRRSGVPPPPGVQLAADGDWLVPTVRGVGLGPEDAAAFLIADNRTTELGGWDEAKLAQMLVDLSETADGLGGVGFDAQDLDRIVSSLLAGVDRQALNPDELPDDEDGEVNVRPGDIFRCGVHYVVCDDARRDGVYDLLVS